MLFILYYFIISVIIARFLEKRMHIAAIFHSVLFIITTLYLLIICNNYYISSLFKHILSENTFNQIRYAITNVININEFEISSVIVIELIMLLLTILLLSITFIKVIKINIKLLNRNFKYVKYEIKCLYIEVIKLNKRIKKIYLNNCVLRY